MGAVLCRTRIFWKSVASIIRNFIDNHIYLEMFHMLALIPHNLLSQEGFKVLDQPISIDEFYNALQAMKKDAAPGEDGLTVAFYLKFWNLVKMLLHESYLHAFECGVLSISQRRGLIRLIPKKIEIYN